MSDTSHSELCAQAYYQIEAMCNAMLKAARADDCGELSYLVQSLAIRIEALNGAMIHANTESNSETLKELRSEVYGSGAEVAHV